MITSLLKFFGLMMKIFYSTNLQGQIIDMINSDDDKSKKSSFENY